MPADGFQLYADEEAGILLARNGVLTRSIPSRSFARRCLAGFRSWLPSWIRSNVKRILIGRTTLDSIADVAAIESLNSMRDLDGSGMLLNENNHPIYHSDKSQSLIL